jgi:hypothetical protein
VEETEGLRPHIQWTKMPDFVHVSRWMSRMPKSFFPHRCTLSPLSHPSPESLSKSQ